MASFKEKLKNPLLVVFFTVFVDMLGFGILIPVIPLLLANPASPYFLLPGNIKPSDGLIMLGFLTAIFPLMQFIATPILGQLSDKYGRKKILAFSLMGTSISYVIFAIGILTKNIPLLFIARGFDGITGGNISVAMASIADVTAPKDRAKAFGLVGAAFGLGFILGPYIGGKLSDPSLVSWFDATTPFWFAAVLSALNVVSVLAIFPNTFKVTQNVVIKWGQSVKNIFKAYTTKGLRTVFTVNFLFNAGFSFFTTFASVFFITKFHFNQGNTGDLFAYIGLWIAISQAVVVGKVAAKLREDQILKFAIYGTGLGILLQFLATDIWQIWLVIPIFAISNGLCMASFNALISKSVDAQSQGEILGISSSVQALAQAIPPILSGYIAVSLTSETPLLVASIVIFVAGIVFRIFFKKAPDHMHIADDDNSASPAFH